MKPVILFLFLMLYSPLFLLLLNHSLGSQALIPLALEGTESGKVKASFALAKIAAVSNPETGFPGERVRLSNCCCFIILLYDNLTSDKLLQSSHLEKLATKVFLLKVYGPDLTRSGSEQISLKIKSA